LPLLFFAVSCGYNHAAMPSKGDSDIGGNEKGKVESPDTLDYVIKYIVCVKESYSYDSLNLLAKRLSGKMEIVYDTVNVAYSKALGVFDTKDSVYYPRSRSKEGQFLSIEMAYVFQDNTEKIAIGDNLLRLILLVTANPQEALRTRDMYIKMGYTDTKYFACKLSRIDPH